MRLAGLEVWEICKFWILLNSKEEIKADSAVWEICKFWILLNINRGANQWIKFERYVNFEFY